MSIIAKQFGFSTASGAIANLVDGDPTTSWTPLATTFAGYPDTFFIGDPSSRVLNVGKSFPALEFDLGEAKRVAQIFIKVQDALTLGPGILIGSDVAATSPADTLQSGDVFLAEYTQQEITSNAFLSVEVMLASDVRKRYLRLLQRSNEADDLAPTPGPPNSYTFDIGAGSFEVPAYSTAFTIEVWGGASSAGLASEANNGGSSSVSKGGGFTITAGGGVKPTATVANSATGAGTGGTASGGNIVNTSGGNGSVPSPADGSEGYSGAGGDAPNGGRGGSAILLVQSLGGEGSLGLSFTRPPNFVYGENGVAPGGAGSGRNFYAAYGVDSQKFPGGGAGSYSKHVVERSSGDCDPGTVLSWVVGDGGASTKGNGKGANGRVRFSWA